MPMMAMQIRSLKLNLVKLAKVYARQCVTQAQVTGGQDLGLELGTGSQDVKLIHELQEQIEEARDHLMSLTSQNRLSGWQHLMQVENPKPKQHQTMTNNTETNPSQLIALNEKSVKTLQTPILSCQNTDINQELHGCVKPYSHTTDDILLHRELSYSLIQSKHIESQLLPLSFLNSLAGSKKIFPVKKTDILPFDHTSEVRHKVLLVSEQTCREDTHRTDILYSQGYEVQTPGVTPVYLSTDGKLLCSSDKKSTTPPGEDRQNRPSLDQLYLIRDHLSDYLPSFFLKRHDYRIYQPDVIFENRLGKRVVVTQGISKYVINIAKLRAYALIKYANVRMHVLGITTHEEDGSVKIRWRISGIPQARAFMFWKFLPWSYKKAMDDESEWLDGLSIFYVDGTGMIYKHVIDTVMPDENKEVKKSNNIAVKLALLLGLTPRASLGDAMSFLCK